MSHALSRPAAKFHRLRLAQWESDPHCAYCKRHLFPEQATLDHILPLTRGGNHSDDNLVLSCQPCNASKADRELEAELLL